MNYNEMYNLKSQVKVPEVVVLFDNSSKASQESKSTEENEVGD